MIRIGIDIGSTTAKMAALDDSGKIVFSSYERHNARVKETVAAALGRLRDKVGDVDVAICVTGSVGMGLAETLDLPFVQEVIAATKAVQAMWGGTRTMIDIGGEDAKVVFFDGGKATDLRMNGNCAGGTGAFIDQMAILLGIDTAELNALAEQSTTIYPIASRCGVFSKTDVQNLIAKNVCREDIAASVFHAVAVQVVVTLAHGCDIEPPVLMCGGPLTFLPALRKAFADYLKLSDGDIILPSDSHLIPAMGAALNLSEEHLLSEECGVRSEELFLSEERGVWSEELKVYIEKLNSLSAQKQNNSALLTPRFSLNENSSLKTTPHSTLKISSSLKTVTLGIDSGSTTTKIVVLDDKGEMVFNYYHNNDGNPIETTRRGLKLFADECKRANADVKIAGSCSTGYGEDLLRASFSLDHGIIETIAHYMAARNLTKDVSFILDIGGQDMKAIFVNDGIINRMEINEACSSGCGSFIETFAKSLGMSIEEFADAACHSTNPYDLGTRCTVFMNSKVKQALREGAEISDIAAGLSYSVVRNCLYKVLRLKNIKELGEHIVMQGGTMKNDSVVRAFEKLIGRKVYRSTHPELMGAIGCALYAREQGGKTVTIDSLLGDSQFTTSRSQCHGCENHCIVTTYRFAGGNRYFSGNRCERIFTNKGKDVEKGENAYQTKVKLLFDSEELKVKSEKFNSSSSQKNSSLFTFNSSLTIGIPRCLNMYEEYPFWRTLFSECGIKVKLSGKSTYNKYEQAAKHVMSDNICFPAKLVHSHIAELCEKGVDRIFMPFVVYEKGDGGQNSFNCPIVSGYAEVVKATAHGDIPIDSPAFTFKDKKLLQRQCEEYLATLGIDGSTAKAAFHKAVKAMDDYCEAIAAENFKIFECGVGKLKILLAGRPYHADPLIQHKISEIIASMGADVITEDIVRGKDIATDDTNFVPQWAYANRILKAAEWVAKQGDEVQFMQMTSFGCGPDAFLVDETRDLLKRHGKTLTLLKIDDVSNIGSLKLRIRSVLASLELKNRDRNFQKSPRQFSETAVFERKDRRRKILIPFFTPFISPLLPSLVRLAGYDAECLPHSDAASAELGLRYANNEVCYPATLIVGDIVKAFESKRYDTKNTAVIISQTGGQCRASNYISLIKKALAEAGYTDVPVLSLATGSGIDNRQPGFKINWLKILPTVVTTLIYSDCLAKLYHASATREREKEAAKAMLDKYLTLGAQAIDSNNRNRLWTLLEEAARDFDNIIVGKECRKIGIVGEIFLKFNPFAQKDITDWLVDQGIEVVPPLLTDFFLQSFVNIRVNQQAHLERKLLPNSLLRIIYNKVWRQIERANTICKTHRYFTPFESIFNKAEESEKAISLYAQFGEGWLLPGEVISLARQGVSHVVSLQPFGCIANHIVARGVEKRIKKVCPRLNMLSLDFDSGVSDVNIRNRILLFIDNLETNRNNVITK